MPIESVSVFDDADRKFGRRTIDLNTDHVVTASRVDIKGFMSTPSAELTLITGAVLYMEWSAWERLKHG